LNPGDILRRVKSLQICVCGFPERNGLELGGNLIGIEQVFQFALGFRVLDVYPGLQVTSDLV
jgi:hypothetical protein